MINFFFWMFSLMFFVFFFGGYLLKFTIELEDDSVEILRRLYIDAYGISGSSSMMAHHLECMVDAMLRHYDISSDLPFPDVE